MPEQTITRLALSIAITLVTTNLHAHGGDTSLVHACVDAENVLRLSAPDQECPAGQSPVHWSIEGPPGPVDPELLGRISTLEAQVATLQQQVAGLVDPVLPEVLISDVTLSEGTSTAIQFAFTVSLSMPSSDTVVIDYFTSDGTADSGDYTPVSDQLIYYPGETSKVVRVSVARDTIIEADETFFLNLGRTVNADGANALGTGTILNDDFPSLSISGRESGAEGELFLYDVTLSSPSPATISVDYRAADGTATLADNDFADTRGTLVFNPGQTSAQIIVQTNSDQSAEGQESFSVMLSDPVNAVLSVAQATSLLLDNQLTMSIQDATVVEGNTGRYPFTILEMTVVLGQTVSGEVSFRYGQTAGGTASNLTLFNSRGDIRVVPFSNCHADTSPSTCPTVTFAPGETQKTITIEVNGDTVVENDENFFIKIFDPIGALISRDTAEGIILDDD